MGEYPSGTFRFKNIDGSFWNGETFRFADYIREEIFRAHTFCGVGIHAVHVSDDLEGSLPG